MSRSIAKPPIRLTIALLLAGVLVITVWYFVRQDRPLAVAPVQLTDDPGQELFPSLSPDGKSLAYSAAGHIYLRPISGGRPTDLTPDSKANNWQPAFSPDGRHIAFRSEREGGGIFIIAASGGMATRVTDFGYNPAWSPDGQEIVVATETFLDAESRAGGASQLSAIRVVTGEKRALTSPGVVPEALQPQWSPHGHRIAYWAAGDIWTIPASGGNPAPITSDPHLDWNPVWSPDGKLLYFASNRGGAMDLWRIEVEENTGAAMGTPVRLPGASGFGGFMSIARLGRAIAYVRPAGSANLHRVAFDPIRETVAGEAAPVTHGARLVFGPDLSPDGARFTFFSWGKREDIFVVGADGSGLRALTDDAHQDRWPRWSPDGTRIAFHSNRSGNFQIWTVRPDGSGLEQVTRSTTEALTLPVWSPDGRMLAYSSDSGSFVMQVGKPPGASLPPWKEVTKRFEAFAWSADGRKLAGHLQPGNDGADTAGIVIYSLESRTYRRITDYGSFPAWLSDSRRILIGDRGAIQLVDTESGRTREVLSATPPVFFALSRDNRMLYFTRVSVEADIWLLQL